MSHLNPVKRVFILFAPGFEESSTIYCLERMRQASLPVLLVSLSAGLVTGQYGVAVHPDLTLDQVNFSESTKLVVIAGGRQCANNLLTDPRVHRLFGSLPLANGVVGVLTTAVPAIVQAYPPNTSPIQFVTQNDKNLEDFVTSLINLSLA